jgi:hypothetical protein
MIKPGYVWHHKMDRNIYLCVAIGKYHYKSVCLAGGKTLGHNNRFWETTINAPDIVVISEHDLTKLQKIIYGIRED